MLAPPDSAPAGARWSEANAEFRRFAERNPEYLGRAAFASLDADRTFRKVPLQPWPVFIGPAQRAELERITLGVDRLARGALERFVGGDRERMKDYYRSEAMEDIPESDFVALEMSDEVLDLVLSEPNGIRGAISRGDYLETPDGLKCMELNTGSFIGGLFTQALGELHLESAPVRRFLAEHGRSARAPDTLAAFFRHVLAETERLGAWSGGEFNVVFLALPHEPDQVALQMGELYNRELRRVLEEDGTAPGGRVFVCAVEDIVDDEGVLRVEGHPVHAVFEQHDGSADIRMLFWFFKHRRVNLLSGPVSALMGDKRNLALVSENAGSDEFTEAERELIARHVPWTRRVLPGRTEFRGRTVRLPEDLVELRGEMVLKKATSLGGAYVHIGRYRTDDEWRALIARALREKDWVAQEYLETVPHALQDEERGVAPNDLVWGLFAFGDHFGGAFLRTHPAGRHGGVVNTKQGAQVAAALEVVE